MAPNVGSQGRAEDRGCHRLGPYYTLPQSLLGTLKVGFGSSR